MPVTVRGAPRRATPPGSHTAGGAGSPRSADESYAAVKVADVVHGSRLFPSGAGVDADQVLEVPMPADVDPDAVRERPSPSPGGDRIQVQFADSEDDHAQGREAVLAQMERLEDECPGRPEWAIVYDRTSSGGISAALSWPSWPATSSTPGLTRTHVNSPRSFLSSCTTSSVVLPRR